MFLDYLVVIVLGVVTSVGDMKQKKIYNRYLILVLFYTIFSNVVQYYLFGGFNYFLAVFVNSIVSLLFSFFLWYSSLWSAADGKLFFIYAALTPLSVYTLGYVPYFPSFTLFLNMILPISLFLLLNLLWITDWNEKKQILKASLNVKQLAIGAVFLAGVNWPLSIVFSYVGIQTNSTFGVLFIVALFMAIMKIAKEYTPLVSSFFFAVTLIFNWESILTLSFASNILIALVVFYIGFSFINNLGFFMFTERVKFDQLKPGMVPIEMIVKREKYEKIRFSGAERNVGGSFLFEHGEGGLSEGDLKKIKVAYAEKKLDFDNLVVMQTLPFAPFMFFGVLLTLLLKGDLFTVGRVYLYKFYLF